jgi:hypothetical protein
MTDYSTPAQKATFLAAYDLYIPTLQADPNFLTFVAAQQAYITAVITPPPGLTDSANNVWTFQPGNLPDDLVLKNGQTQGAWPNAITAAELALSGGAIFAHTSAGNWYAYNGTQWVAASAPSPITATLAAS